MNPSAFKDPQFAGGAHVLDVRFWDFYLPKHIAGSINVDAKEWVTAFASDPSRQTWEKRLAHWESSTTRRLFFATTGQARTRRAQEQSCATGASPTCECLTADGTRGYSREDLATPRRRIQLPKRSNSNRHETSSSRQSQLVEMLRAGGIQIVDACTSTAAEPSVEIRSAAESASAGSAKRLGWASIIAWRRSPDFSAVQLDRLVRGAGIDLTLPTIVYSESFGDAAAVAFSLELLGTRTCEFAPPTASGQRPQPRRTPVRPSSNRRCASAEALGNRPKLRSAVAALLTPCESRRLPWRFAPRARPYPNRSCSAFCRFLP